MKNADFDIFHEKSIIANIAVVIVNWNKKNDVLTLLTQLAQVTEPEFDIFVVDNASSDHSVEAIKQKFPDVKLIVNKRNLGGTGGFNSGIDHICKTDKYSYIWLLDNDAKINKDTLKELYKAIKSDPAIGIAASRIVDIENKEMTVETGGNFRWDIIGVDPVQRNSNGFRSDTDTVSVDYVAICSAIVRIDALKKVGLMDERLFLFWDDMDWGLSFKKNGFKVVAAVNSIVYHGSFTERDRGAVTNFYYGIRNPFLVYTKNTRFFKRSKIFYRSLRYFYRISFILKIINNKYEARLIEQAIKDYRQNRWGEFSPDAIIKRAISFDDHGDANPLENRDRKIHKILVSLVGIDFHKAKMMLDALQSRYPEAEMTILVQKDRAGYYDHYNLYGLDKESMHNMRYMVSVFIDIFFLKFDLIAFIKPSPFMGAVKRAIVFDHKGYITSSNNMGYFSIPVQAMAAMIGEVAALLSFPVLMYKSLQYKRKMENPINYN